ncbi:hypothetical protein MJG53_005548 [Ovis ammon polii x Ovis aries]|uniref:Uncharacterized protein n=1 Tax=Ovis ammon polii x Ovis aries TaxID=2918886 RepID=A0ACB9VCS0_9CETA|nr:hypothetical protein MJG53_005548 [Ovis ammon polii x Ovis aries]
MPPQRCQAPQDAAQARTPPPGPGPAAASASSRAPAETGVSQMTTSASGGRASSPGKSLLPTVKGPAPLRCGPPPQRTPGSGALLVSGNDDKDEKQPPEWTLSMCSAPCLGSLYTPSIASSRLEEVSPTLFPGNQLLALDATPSKDDPCSGRHRCSIGPAPSHQQIYRWLPWSRASTCVQEAGHTMQATAAFALKILV